MNNLFHQYATHNGNKIAVGDYSAGAEFGYTADDKTDIARMIVHIEGPPGEPFDSSSYGHLPALANGIQVLHLSGTVVLNDLTDGLPIKSNGQWSRVCYDVGNIGGNVTHIGIRWSFFKSGKPVRLRGGESLVVRLQDNFSELVDHSFNFQGVR